MAAPAHIKNPLSIIGIFAGFVEVMGIGVLPLLGVEIQKVYVWFLMFFPTLLVGAFFYTLIRHPKSLYAPGDFQHDASWLATHFPPATAIQIEDKIQEEIKAGDQTKTDLAVESPSEPAGAKAEVVAPSLIVAGSGGPHVLNQHVLNQRATSLLELDRIEGRAIKLIGQERGLDFKRNLRYAGSPPIIIDGLAVEQDRVVMVEVRYSSMGSLFINDIRKYLDRANVVYEVLKGARKANFEFIMMVVHSQPDTELAMKSLLSSVKFENEAKRYPFKATFQSTHVDLLPPSFDEKFD